MAYEKQPISMTPMDTYMCVQPRDCTHMCMIIIGGVIDGIIGGGTTTTTSY